MRSTECRVQNDRWVMQMQKDMEMLMQENMMLKGMTIPQSAEQTAPRLASFAVRGRGTDSRKWRVIDNPSEVTDVTPPPLTQGRLLVEGVQGSL